MSSDDSDNSTVGFRQSGRLSGPSRLIMSLGLVVASVATGALTVASILAARLPGCGGSMQGTSLTGGGWGGCDDAAMSVWGRIVIGSVTISTATLGLGAYVGTLILLWMSSSGAALVRWVFRGLALGSLIFLIVSASQRFWCPYCMVAHAGVLLAWIGAECSKAPHAASPTRRAWIAALLGCVLIVSSATWVDHYRQHSKARVASETATQQIVKTPATLPDPKPSTSPADASVSGTVSPTSGNARFTGRYRLGDGAARARVVVISDFQCADCQKLEKELMELASRSGVSLSMKHFPFCRDCNPNVPRTLHANACWAARAAEAAGMVGGERGFWEMHHWLFARGGSFTEPELRTQVARQGLTVDQFMAAFTGRESLERVKADVAEAMTLGISRTPMVFVNGVECEGWESAGTVTRIVSAVLEANLPVDANATDQPPSALQKYLTMWRTARVETPALTGSRQREDGIARIEVVGDYQESGTRELCGVLAQILAEGWSAGFIFHHYPADPACNPAIPRKMNDRACELSTLVLACGMVGGDEAYWKAHDRALMLGAMPSIPADLALPFAQAAGLDVARLREDAVVREATLRLSESVRKSGTLSITELPTVFINGRRMARWKGGVDSKELLRAAIIEACNGSKRQESK